MNELHLFTGAGGGVLGGMLLGHTPVCAVEIEEYPRKVLLQRQRDGILPRFPIWDDIRTFDGRPWRGRVDIVCGGFPCQDISSAGKGEGIDGERSGLWSEMARVTDEIRPDYVLLENSPRLNKRGLARVGSDLAEIGYDIRWDTLSSSDVGRDHERKRLWGLAYPKGRRLEEGFEAKGVSLESKPGAEQLISKSRVTDKREGAIRGIPPEYFRASDGVADWMDRLKAIGNGQDPAVAATAFRILTEGL